MKASPEDQLRLLEVQALDSALDRLAHRRRTLPELEQLDTLGERLATIGDDVVTVETEDRDLAREQAKVEGDVDTVRSRMARDQERLDTGAVSSPRELENLQSEIASLHRRQADLEDAVLELMERREEVETRLGALRAEQAQLTEERAAAEQRRDAAFAEIDAEAERARKERAALVGTLPDDLVKLYEKVRESAGGVGAAALHRGRCEGCHLQLNTVDVNALREAPPDDVVRCEECRRILIRTPESGL